MKSIALFITILLSVISVTGCISAKDIYDYNYNDDKSMTDSMMKDYGDPFWKNTN